MEKEFENYNQEQAADQQSENREGYQERPSSYQRQFRQDGRPQRPRIQTQRTYVREEGFRPEGIDTAEEAAQAQKRDGQAEHAHPEEYAA